MDRLYCGVDIGGTKCSIALIDGKGNLADKITTCAHVDAAEEEVIRLVAVHVKEILHRNHLGERDVPGIGVGCAGHIRYREGIMMTSSNLTGFKNYPLRDTIQSHFAVPVLLENDTNAQALAEYRFGAGKGYRDMVFMTISTGIGAGFIINGELYRGMTGTAGEIGHAIVDPRSDLPCTCGNKGCLMACASGLALPYLFQKKLDEGMETRLDLPPDFIMSRMSGQLLKKGLEMGDPVSRAVILESGRYVGIGVYNIFQALNPPVIVLGGGLINWGDLYMNRIRETFYELARDMIFDPLEITVSKIPDDAGVIGAAALTIEMESDE
jgi:glucokinase